MVVDMTTQIFVAIFHKMEVGRISHQMSFHVAVPVVLDAIIRSAMQDSRHPRPLIAPTAPAQVYHHFFHKGPAAFVYIRLQMVVPPEMNTNKYHQR
jgi:hypothetical protein